MNRPGCECVAALIPTGDDRAYCSKCGREYVRARTVTFVAPEQTVEIIELAQKPETD